VPRPASRSRPARTTLLIPLLAVAFGSAACTPGDPDPAPIPTTRRAATVEELAQARAVQVVRGLLDDATEARPARPAQRSLASQLSRVHGQRLTALGAPPPSLGTDPTPAPSVTATGTTTPAAGTTPASTGRPVTLPALSLREARAAARVLADVPAVEPALATLLARLAAGLAVDADLLARSSSASVPGRVIADPGGVLPTPQATPTASGSESGRSTGVEAGTSDDTDVTTITMPAATRDALTQELDGEHAAVYAYGLIAGRLRGQNRERALAEYARHVELRDRLEAQLVVAGVDPPAAAAAYGIADVPDNRAEAAILAGRIESALAALAAQTVGATEGQDRAEAAARLVAAARRAAAWTGRPTALPGAVA
jgi:hypothetical protein